VPLALSDWVPPLRVLVLPVLVPSDVVVVVVVVLPGSDMSGCVVDSAGGGVVPSVGGAWSPVGA
jgi:hypothetical protein